MTGGHRHVRLPLAALVCAALLAAGCGTGSGQGTGTRPSPAPAGSAPSGPASPPCTVTAPGFSCRMQGRIAAARHYAAAAPGQTGLVLHDRVTGATWRSAGSGRIFPAASTIKLAMAADLLERDEAGTITLTRADRALLDAALRESSDSAADGLWSAFEDAGFLARIRRYGMTSASFTASPAYWGAMVCSPRDLNNLMNYVLTTLSARDRRLVTGVLRHVSPNQRWGVWGAGPGNRPGNKNGWVHIGGTWTVSSVGFAGPGARYTLAMMTTLTGEAGFATGTNTLTQAAALLLQGHRVPAPTVSATP